MRSDESSRLSVSFLEIEARTNRDEITRLRAENARLRQRIEELKERLRVADKVNRQFGPELLEADKRADAAEARLAKVVEALIRAEEWMSDEGCDCGVDEPGTCALCVAEDALAAAKGE